MASRTKNEKVMWTISEKFPRLLEHLATNRNLPSDLWLKLFKKAPVGLASNLVNNRDFTREELNLALKDKRKTVKTYIFRNGFNPLFVKEAKEILRSTWFTAEHAQLWLRSGKVNPKLVKDVIKRTSEPYMIECFKDSNLFTLEEVVDSIKNLNLNYSSIIALAKLIESRPELVEPLVSCSKGSLHGALAGSRTLFNQEVWARFIKVLEGDIKTTFARDAVWMALANPNIDKINTKRLVQLAESLPKSIYQYKLLNIKQDSLLKTKRLLVNEENYLYLSTSWQSIEDPALKSLVDTAIKVLNPVRYPLYYKEVHKDQWGTQTRVNESETKKPEAVTLDFIPSKDRIHYSEDLEKLVSESLVLPEQWETMLGLLIDWDASFAELISTAIELSK